MEDLDALVPGWLTLREVADVLEVSETKVRQMVRDHQLAAVRSATLGQPAVPADFLVDGSVVKGLGGTLTLLCDHGLSQEESVEWLFTADDSLPGRPIDALREDRGKEVRRRAQVVV